MSRTASATSPSRRPLVVTALVTLTAVLACVVGPSADAAPLPPDGDLAAETTGGRYVITLTGRPLLTYGGGVEGLAATRVAPGRAVRPRSVAAERYRDYLVRRQDAFARRVGVTPGRHYSLSLNAFTATMSPEQARSLERTPGVLAVSKDQRLRLEDDKNPVDFLRLMGPRGVWTRLGGAAQAGRGVVVGVLDSGVWPGSASFAAPALGSTPSRDPYRPYRRGSTTTMRKADGNMFTGSCAAAQHWSADLCNTKLISARYFSKTYEAVTPEPDRTDVLSPRDGDGHGTHTASTAVGNADVPATVAGNSYGLVSGVAPAAKLAVYKVGFTDAYSNEPTIYTSDALDAVDAAILDGVDVINYSISSSDSPVDPVDLAFLSAASAGIFVATAAGNSGPGASTAQHSAPWVTTVAASTVAPYTATVELGSGERYAGISTTVLAPVGPAPLVAAVAVKLAPATDPAASVCSPGTLDPSQVADRIVVCDRGQVDRVAKSAEVARAGGLAMVLANLKADSQDPDTHSVPTVHLAVPGATAVQAYAATAGATARLVPGSTGLPAPTYPQIAGFSARGPSLGARGDLLKPDLAAPGVGVLAAVAPPSNSGRSFDFYSGTSMAAPHVAGLAALYFAEHPTWSPMAVKSALMTTALRTKNATGAVNRDGFAQGAGNVRPRRMLHPGVVFDSAEADWLSYLQGLGVDTGTQLPAVDPSDYNSPSIAVGRLIGTQTVTRRVTSVEPGVYSATIAVPGVLASVTPSILTFDAAGETRTIEVRFRQATAPVRQAAFGSLYLRGPGTQARVPVAVTPVALDAPAVVRAPTGSGSLSYQVTPGISGDFALAGYGLQAMDRLNGRLSINQRRGFALTFPAAKVLHFDVRPSTAGADLDLVLYRVTGDELEQVAAAATSDPDEMLTVPDTPAGTYLISVTDFSDAPGTSWTAFSLLAGAVAEDSPGGSFAVTPVDASVQAGEPFTVTASWSDLAAQIFYLGLVTYPDGSRTLVEVNDD